MTKRFFYVCAGVFLLALSYHLGANTATAQAPGNSVVSISPGIVGYDIAAVTAGGDLYGYNSGTSSWTRLNNVFGSGPTPVKLESMGAVKRLYR